MTDATPPQSSVDPRIQAHRAEKAIRGAALARQYRDADLAAIGLPPAAIAAVGASGRAIDADVARSVAEVLFVLAAFAGLANAAERLFAAMMNNGYADSRAHVFHAPFLARAEMARRLLDHAISVDNTAEAVGAYLASMRPQQRQRAQLLGLWLSEAVEDAGLLNVGREVVARYLASVPTTNNEDTARTRVQEQPHTLPTRL